MKGVKLPSSVLILLGVILLGNITSAAKILDFRVEPASPIWMEYNTNALELHFYLNCSINESSNITKVVGVLTLPDGTQTALDFQKNVLGIYEATYIAENFGDYTVGAVCQDDEFSDAKSISFTIKKPYIDIKYPTPDSPINTYPLSEFDVRVKFTVNNQPVDVLLEPSFQAYLIGEDERVWQLRVTKATYSTDAKVWNLEVEVEDANIPPGVYDLEVKASAIMDGGERVAIARMYNIVRMEDALKILLISPNPTTELRLGDTTKINITLQVLEKGVPITFLTAENFEVKIEGNGITRNVPITQLTYDPNTQRYILEVQIPKLPSSDKPYSLYLTVSYGSYLPAKSESIPVYFVLSITGQLVDPAGNIVSAVFKIRGDIGEITFKTDSLGRYQTSVPAGTYEFEMRFPEISKAIIKGVEINDNLENGIKYDHFTGNPGIEGMKVYKLVVLEFAPKFKRAQLTIPYNDAMVKNEKNLKVYLCEDWNFGRRECVGKWDDVDATVDIVSDVVKVNTTKLGAFVLGERKQLAIELNEVKGDYYANEKIEVSGVVRDDDGDPVESVNVIARVKDTAISANSTTNVGGKFSVVLMAPNADGSFVVEVKAVKEPYASFTKTFTIHVQRKVEMKAYAPDVVTAYLGKEKVVDITLENPGQVAITNIDVQVTGIKYEWYAIVPKSISILKPGEKKIIKMYIRIPAEDCAEEGACQKYYFPKITFNGKEKQESVSFTLKLKEMEEINQTETQQQEAQPTGWSIKLPELNISGLMTMSGAEKTNMYLSIFFVVLIFTIATVKKKKKLKLRSRVVPFGRRRF